MGEAEALRRDLRRAVAAGDLAVCYQPVMALPSEVLVGFEALARWRHPERGILAPAEFIPVAEQDDTIQALGSTVLHQACSQLARWAEAVPGATVGIAVNVSPLQLSDPRFVSVVQRALRYTGVRPAQLCLEITESADLGRVPGLTSVVRQLRATGVRLAIDDFGTSYASFSSLRELEVDHLKVDGRFVRQMEVSPADQVIVASIVGLADRLGLAAVAEHVETAGQRDTLVDLGCPLGQGFYWSPAVSADEATELIAAHGAGAANWRSPWSVPLDAPARRRRGRGTGGAAGGGAGGGSHRRRAATGLGPVPGVALPPVVESDEVGALVSYLTHETRAPLHAIVATAGHLRVAVADALGLDVGSLRPTPGTSGPGQPGGRRAAAGLAALEAVALLERQAEVLSHLVSALGDAQRIGRGELVLDPAPVDLVALVRAVVGDLAAELEGRPVAIGGPAEAVVSADRHRVGQALTNLLVNAAKFSPPGAAIDVVVEQRGASVALHVIDRGPGIPFDRVRDAFRRFASLDQRRRGTGLGLYLAQGIAVAHGGALTYQRAPTGGAQFTLELPVGPGATAPPGRTAPTARRPTAGPSSSRSVAPAAGVCWEPEMAGVVESRELLAAAVRDDPVAWRALADAYRALRHAATPAAMTAVAVELVDALGGEVVSEDELASPGASSVGPQVLAADVLPVDLSLGEGPGLFVRAEPLGVARMRLEAILPLFVGDVLDSLHRHGDGDPAGRRRP